MRRGPSLLDKWRRLSRAERHLLLEATAVLGVTAAALRTLPSSWVVRVVDRARREAPGHSAPSAASVAKAVHRASRRVPKATCLAQALTGWWMLSRRHESVRLGVGARKQKGEVSAHAWLEADGVVVLGDDERASHVELS